MTHFDGARFLTRAFYINWLSAHAVKRAPSKALNNVLRVIRSCIKMHATIWNNAPVACNSLHEIVNTRKVMNNVLWVVHSCIKMHATDEIMNPERVWITFRAWFFRATSCTLQGITRGMCLSCFKMHATIWKKTRRWANVKQCKLKAWDVAVVDLWLFFEYHAEVKV